MLPIWRALLELPGRQVRMRPPQKPECSEVRAGLASQQPALEAQAGLEACSGRPPSH